MKDTFRCHQLANIYGYFATKGQCSRRQTRLLSSLKATDKRIARARTKRDTQCEIDMHFADDGSESFEIEQDSIREWDADIMRWNREEKTEMSPESYYAAREAKECEELDEYHEGYTYEEWYGEDSGVQEYSDELWLDIQESEYEHERRLELSKLDSERAASRKLWDHDHYWLGTEHPDVTMQREVDAYREKVLALWLNREFERIACNKAWRDRPKYTYILCDGEFRRQANILSAVNKNRKRRLAQIRSRKN